MRLLCLKWYFTNYMLLYVHSSSTTFSNYFFFRDGSLALMIRAFHDEKLAQAIDSSLAHLMW